MSPYSVHTIVDDDALVPDSIPDDHAFTVTHLRSALSIVHHWSAHEPFADRETHDLDAIDDTTLTRLHECAHACALAAAQSELQTTVSIEDALRLRRMLGRCIDHEFCRTTRHLSGTCA